MHSRDPGARPADEPGDSSRSPRRPPSLKFHLAALLVPFVTLVGIAAAYQATASLDQAEERRQLGVQFRADLAAHDIDAAIESAVTSVTETARSPGLTPLFGTADTSACSLVFGGPAPFSSGHLDVLDTEGKVLCSSLEEPMTTGYAGSDWLTAGLLDAAVAGPVEDAATGQRVLILTAPVGGDGVVAAFLDVDPVVAALSERLSGPIDTEFALVDPAAGAAGASPDAARWLTATSAVPSLGWEVQARSDRAASTAEAKTLNEQVLAYLLGCIVVLLIAVLVVYRGIARPIEKLSASVRGVVAGGLDAVPVVVNGPGEVVALSGDFARLVESVQVERVHRRNAEQAQAQVQLEREADAAMLRSIVQSTQSLIYVKDLGGHYLMANAAFTRACGIAESDLIGLTDMDLSPANAAAWAADDMRARSGVYEVEEWLGDAGDRRCVESIKFPLHNARGELYAVGGVSLDVTERRRTTAVIAHARDAALAANAAKSTFLATMSHEIRTPMTAVIGMTDLLAHTDLTVHQHELVATIQSSGDSLLAVINNILDISKIESGELQLELAAVQLPREIERCFDLVAGAAADKGIELVCEVDDSCPERLMGDVVRIRQILTNLLANAVKFTERGEVVVKVSAADEPGEGGVVLMQIAVTDSGIGISEQSLARLFKSFSQVDASTTRMYGGTGLGLVIARRLAEAMGGGVTVTSTLGQGSTFLVTLALQRCADATPTEEDGADPAGVLAGRSVLVVDDNHANLHALEVQVERLGMACTTSDAAADALALVDGGLTYDVAVLDLGLPGDDGRSLGRALRDSDGASADAPQVLLTEVGRTPAGIEDEFAGLVTKPVKTLALRDALAAAVTGDTAPHAAAAGPTPAPAARRLRILVAEDHPVNRRVVELMLHELGHDVDMVGDGGAAVDAIAAHQYDVVLMDLQMPRMDGLEATKRVRAGSSDRPQPHIIAMTASTLVDDRIACAAAGMDSYLSKPVRALELQATLERTTGADGRRQPEWLDPAVEAPLDAHPAYGPAVDVGVLDALLADCADDGGLRAELITHYLADGTALIQELLAATDAGDHRRLARAAHTLRSPSALLGAAVLADLLTSAEHPDTGALPAHEWPTADISREYARVASALRPLMIVEDLDGDRAHT